MKYLIVSQPKAGTHLCANLLTEFGLQNSNLLLFPERYIKWQDWESDKFHDSKRVDMKFQLSIKLVPDNTFAMTHITPDRHDCKELTQDFKKILVTRNTDDIFESLERFKQEKNVPVNRPVTMQRLEKTLDWALVDNVFHITFEKLINKDIDSINSLQNYLLGDIKHDSEQAINNAIANDSPTKSSIR